MDTVLMNTAMETAIHAPEWVQLIPPGRHETPKGVFIADAESRRAVIQAYETRKNPMVIDYEHQSLAGVEAPAAGWITAIEDRGDTDAGGIWARVEWTARASEYLANREYRYLSPVFRVRLSDRRVVALDGAHGLTNMPNIDGMVPVVNKGVVDNPAPKEESPMLEELKKALGLPDTATEKDIMGAVTHVTAVNKAAVEALGVAPGTAPDAVKEKLTSLSSAAMVNKKVASALALPETASESEIIGTLTAAAKGAEGTETLVNRVAELERQIAERDAERLVNSALEDGKITPAQTDWARQYAATDPKGFAAFVNKAPRIVPMGPGHAPSPSAHPGAPDDVQQMVNNTLGVTEAQFKKHYSNGGE